jgi:hypothetical protein
MKIVGNNYEEECDRKRITRSDLLGCLEYNEYGHYLRIPPSIYHNWFEDGETNEDYIMDPHRVICSNCMRATTRAISGVDHCMNCSSGLFPNRISQLDVPINLAFLPSISMLKCIPGLRLPYYPIVFDEVCQSILMGEYKGLSHIRDAVLNLNAGRLHPLDGMLYYLMVDLHHSNQTWTWAWNGSDNFDDDTTIDITPQARRNIISQPDLNCMERQK